MRRLLPALLIACGGPSKPPPPATPPPTCVAVADHVRKLAGKDDEPTQRLRQAFLERCETDGWSDEVKTCITTTESFAKPKRCKDLLSGLQRTALDRAVNEAGMGTSLNACERYVKVTERLQRCTSYPQEQREQYRETAQYMMEAYENMESDEERESYEQHCESSIDQLQMMMPECT